MILNPYLNRFRSVKHLNGANYVMECLGHFDSIVPSLACILTKQHGIWWKIPLENPWKCHFRDSKLQSIPRCLGPQELVPLVQVPKPSTIHYWPAT